MAVQDPEFEQKKEKNDKKRGKRGFLKLGLHGP
jgi:hypothetical protein